MPPQDGTVASAGADIAGFEAYREHAQRGDDAKSGASGRATPRSARRLFRHVSLPLC
jgi:hypothetical protein